MWTKDPEVKDFVPPFSTKPELKKVLTCTGKNIADGVESMLGAFFLSNNLRLTLEFISNIRLVPLREAGQDEEHPNGLLDYVPDKDLRFNLNDDLDGYGFKKEDRVDNVMMRYFSKHGINE